MLTRNGRQLAANCTSRPSAVEKRFFDVFFRWSRIGCAATGVRRSSTETPPEQTHSQKVRKILRYMPSSVVVLTTTASPNEGVIDWTKPLDTNAEDSSLYRGMTLSSFTSFSMSPEPRVTFNIAFPSRTLSALTQTRHFLIHVMQKSGRAVAIADAFAGRSHNESTPENDGRKGWPTQTTLGELRRRYGVQIIPHKVKIGPENSTRALPLPLIGGSRLTIAIFECQVLGESDRAGGGLIRIGDHALVVAKVTRVLKDDPRGGAGLSYCGGTYTSALPLQSTELKMRAQQLREGEVSDTELDDENIGFDVGKDDVEGVKAA
ncbi:hypothetical protein VTL71DRAFT_7993 [Oculimacula yallundae]|uniref:Flavin reductase like domain-containing protein n=1 Tax=Oculimacula yallundae TaxID=86028 RepID=A0ABR4CWF0_9HELO